MLRLYRSSLQVYFTVILKVLLGNIGEASRTFYNYQTVWKQYGGTPEFYQLVNNKVFPKREGYPLRPGLFSIERLFFLIFFLLKNSFFFSELLLALVINISYYMERYLFFSLIHSLHCSSCRISICLRRPLKGSKQKQFLFLQN